MATISRPAEALVLTPHAAAEASRSSQLAALIGARAAEQGGWLPFSEFMQAALYEPELGYYMAERPIFGAAGDFTTAPELSPLFAACLAHSVAGLLAATGGGDIVEFGAGSGLLAAELVAALDRQGVMPRRYRIVETSPVLARRQRDFIDCRPAAAPLSGRFDWLTGPPAESWQGVALANEVLDALPCERFRIAAGGCEAIGVAPVAGAMQWAARPAGAALARAVADLQARLPEAMPPGFVSELRLGQGSWVAAATAGLARGAMLVTDYGLPRAQYYHPSRHGGSLCGFRRHLRVDRVLASPGAQDLTAWVDFSALADEARAAGLEVGGFSTQAHFLLSTGVDREFARLMDDPRARSQPRRAAMGQGAATLLLPGEMGERFKVMALTRGVDGPLAGFGFRDLSASL